MGNQNQETYVVKNRSAGVVVYSIPDLGVRRQFEAGEVKQLTFTELEKLSYQPGGRYLMENYLLITDPEVREDLYMETEPEYELQEIDIVNLIDNGDIVDWENTLNFAPEGLKDLIIRIAVEHGIDNVSKRVLLKEILGFDLDAAERLGETDIQPVSNKPVRKVKPAAAAKPVRKEKNENPEPTVQEEAAPAQEEAPAQPKRGRGRPRKNA